MNELITTSSIIELLSKTPAFRDFSEKELLDLATLAHPMTFDASTELPFKLDNNHLVFYIITQGHSKLSYHKHDLRPVRICGPGDFIGYGEWNFKHSHLATTIDSLSCLCFHREPFQNYLHTSARLQETMIKVLCDILSIKNERISALENHSIGNRIASVLLSFSEKFGKRTADGIRINAKVDRETIAKLAGTVPESLSRQLSDLEKDKIIRREGRTIFILQWEKLEQKSRV